MANPPLDSSDYAAPSPALDSMIEARSHPTYTPKHEDSPAPSRSTSPGPDSVVTDTIDNNGASMTAGRKRKLNSSSSRGVANLTPDQLAKKRANDRQAQRAIRERTKGHIEALEQQVRDLSSQKPFLDLQAAIQHNERIRQAAAAADRLYAESIASVDTPSPIRSTSAPGSRRNSHNGGLQASSFRNVLDSQRHHISHGLDFGVEERLGFNFLLDPSQNVPKLDRLRRSSSENLRSSHPTPPSPLYLQPLCYPSDRAPTAFATPIKNTGPVCPLDSILLDFLHNRQREAAQGIPRQKLVGPPYPSVSSLLNPEKSANSHPVSKVFTDILHTFPDIASLPEQVAVLYTMFLLMRWQIYPTQENYDRLPEWLTPRPTQLLQAHPAWIDYIAWPRMRDRLVTSYQNYPFENWFIPFTRGLSVNWPYEATDCLLSAGDSDELLINPVFERHMRNIFNWSLGPLFAESYPNLVDTTRIVPEPT
ncbi:uncharacterized protein N7498_005467 [Penicillium cinerascens]|uniref:BZIP transcription factor n=1 Tax=Penicillium cinerascens TaxID=70096 RepID=A0A9W9T059_9EURO|nr:uncharacterized protein N7498_005467 [Penicillium cinerascens]KAJ5204588.1 hypothetical protein N7498_005467 [Penicillium cinerascens]